MSIKILFFKGSAIFPKKKTTILVNLVDADFQKVSSYFAMDILTQFLRYKDLIIFLLKFLKNPDIFDIKSPNFLQEAVITSDTLFIANDSMFNEFIINRVVHLNYSISLEYNNFEYLHLKQLKIH